MNKVVEYVGRFVLFICGFVLSTVPRYAFDQVAVWTPQHNVEWTIASVTLWCVSIAVSVCFALILLPGEDK